MYAEAEAEINNLVDEETGEQITPEKLPDSINNYFAGIGKKLAKNFNCRTHQRISYIPKKKPLNFEITETDEEIVRKRLNEIDTNKSSGMANLKSTFIISAITALTN